MVVLIEEIIRGLSEVLYTLFVFLKKERKMKQKTKQTFQDGGTGWGRVICVV